MFATMKLVARASRVLSILILVLTATPATMLAADRCTEVIPLEAGETWRDPGRDTAETVCFDLAVDTAGLLAIDLLTADLVTADPAAAAGAWLDDEGSRGGGPRPLQRSATHLVLAASSPSIRVAVVAEDPRRSLPSFRLITRFVAGIAKSETDSEIEVEPDPLVGCRGTGKSETDSEIEVEPDPLTGPRRAELCGGTVNDDHGDSQLCATQLPRGRAVQVHGVLANDWGDDVDVFRFRVERIGPVSFAVLGEAELRVEILDRHGQRLEMTAFDRDGLRRVRTLVPGTYALRLTGLAGSEGRYSVEIDPGYDAGSGR